MFRQICGGYVHRQPSAAMIQTQSWAMEVPKLFTSRRGKDVQGKGFHLSFLNSCVSSLKPLITVIPKDEILEEKNLTL